MSTSEAAPDTRPRLFAVDEPNSAERKSAEHSDAGVGTTPRDTEREIVTSAPTGEARGSGFGSWMRQSAILTRRQLLVLVRDRGTLFEGLVTPAFTMLMLNVVLGHGMELTTGHKAAYGIVPLAILIGSMFGSLAGAVRLTQERRTGVLTRLYVMPVHRAAELTSRVAAELVRILATSTVLLIIGFAIGFRVTHGVGSVLAILGIALLYGIAFSTMVLGLAVATVNFPLVQGLALLSTLLMFFNTGFAPASNYPGWMQPLVRHQPMSPAIEAMRGLSLGGPVARPLAETALWALVLFAVFAVPAVRGYTRAARNS